MSPSRRQRTPWVALVGSVLIAGFVWIRREESISGAVAAVDAAPSVRREQAPVPAASPVDPPVHASGSTSQSPEATPLADLSPNGRQADATLVVRRDRPHSEADRENGGVVLKEVRVDEVITRKRWFIQDRDMVAEIFVMLGRGATSADPFRDSRRLNTSYTHSLYLPEIWHYDTRTGEYALLSSPMALSFRLNEADRALMNAILALGYASP